MKNLNHKIKSIKRIYTKTSLVNFLEKLFFMRDIKLLYYEDV